jgi:putative endonuclease
LSRLAHRHALGEGGESVAAIWLEGLGYRVLGRNHRCRRGEIDIVAEEEGCLCFVEVRTRGPSWVTPAETVGFAKQRRVVAAARHYLVHQGAGLGPRPLRFDVVEVQMDTFEGMTLSLYRNAFDAGE